MFVTLAPSMSRITKVRSLVPPCFDTSAPRNTPGPCRFMSTKLPGCAGALSPCVRRGLQTPGAHVAVSACGRGGAFLRFAMWTSLHRGTSVPMERGPQPCPVVRALSRHAPLPGSSRAICYSARMLAELHERDAAGEIAKIYAEIRRFWAVPYVSSLQRHLATRPGWLEWTWAALRPVFVSGTAQRAAWRAAENLQVPKLAPMPAPRPRGHYLAPPERARRARHPRHHGGRAAVRSRAVPDARRVALLPRPRGDGARPSPARRRDARGVPKAAGSCRRRSPSGV